MYKYIFFDLDGTITDSTEGITKSISYALINLGYKVPPVEELYVFIGPPLKDSFIKYFNMEEETAKEAVRLYRERYSDVGKYECTPYEGIPALFKALKEDGRKLLIASSKPTEFVIDILKHFNMYEYFDVISGADMAGLRGEKEDVIREALRQINITDDNKKEVVMIGDRHYDINGAKLFGLDSIGVQYGFAETPTELAEAGATYVVNTVGELSDLLLS